MLRQQAEANLFIQILPQWIGALHSIACFCSELPPAVIFSRGALTILQSFHGPEWENACPIVLCTRIVVLLMFWPYLYGLSSYSCFW